MYNIIFNMMMLMPIILLMYMYMLFLLKTSKSPMKILLMTIFYILMLSTYALTSVPTMYLFMVIIIYISGLLILFSYFISLINKLLYFKNSNKFMIFIMSLYYMYMLKNQYKFKNTLSSTNDKMLKILPLKSFKIYEYKNLFMLILVLTMLFLILLISMKLCMIKKMSLRQWKKYNE